MPGVCLLSSDLSRDPKRSLRVHQIASTKIQPITHTFPSIQSSIQEFHNLLQKFNEDKFAVSKSTIKIALVRKDQRISHKFFDSVRPDDLKHHWTHFWQKISNITVQLSRTNYTRSMNEIQFCPRRNRCFPSVLPHFMTHLFININES